MAPLIVSRTTGGPGAHARAGDSAHIASKALPQRKIRPPKPVQPRDERRTKRKFIPRRPDPLDFRPRSQYLHRRKNEQAESPYPMHAARRRGSFSKRRNHVEK